MATLEAAIEKMTLILEAKDKKQQEWIVYRDREEFEFMRKRSLCTPDASFSTILSEFLAK